MAWRRGVRSTGGPDPRAAGAKPGRRRGRSGRCAGPAGVV